VQGVSNKQVRLWRCCDLWKSIA